MTPDDRFTERRQFTRIPTRFIVMMKLDIKHLADYAIDAEIINISEGGMLLELRDIKSPETGTQNGKISFFFSNLQLHEQLLWLQFRLPNIANVVQAIAKPVWIEKPAAANSGFCLLGVQYTQLMPEAQMAITRYISERLKLGS
ncbi:MAG: PilZ domain-containing protein [bacterium]|nr:PilZ domain-containing protein [bacterium]